jgi:aminocarboxymuconate-semialdehyde decarboxylase
MLRSWLTAKRYTCVRATHPVGSSSTHRAAQLQQRIKGNGSEPLATTIALSHLIFEGTLDRYPMTGLSAVLCRPFRSRLFNATRPVSGRYARQQQKGPSEYLKGLYFDTMVFRRVGVVAEVGASQLMVGTDFPYAWTRTAVDLILDTPGLSDDDKVAILGGTAAKLLPLNA